MAISTDKEWEKQADKATAKRKKENRDWDVVSDIKESEKKDG